MGWNIVSGPIIGAWVAERTNGAFSQETCTAIGLQHDDGRIASGVVYENCNGQSLVAHMAVAGPLTRSYLGAIFHYAFGFCGVRKVILPVPSTNAPCHRFVRHLGFSEEARIRDAAPFGDIVLYTLEKSACRFLGDEYVKA